MSEDGLALGEAGAGGLRAGWAAPSPDGAVAEHIEFQYAGMEHQADTATAGMWLFLATELLFFGGLFYLYAVYRAAHPAGFAEASRHTELWLGTVNTVLLLTTSAVFAWAVGRAREGRNRAVFRAAVATGAVGTLFILLKLWEWHGDLDKGLFPGPGFALGGHPDAGGAALFWCFYWLGTGLHLLHMAVGIGLVAYVALGAHRRHYSARYATPVEAVGLYWSFVDMVWLVLYPTIYLAGRAS